MTVAKLIDILAELPGYYEIRMVDGLPITKATVIHEDADVYLSDWMDENESTDLPQEAL